MTKIFKELNSIIGNINKGMSSITFDTIQIIKPENGAPKDHIVTQSSYSNSKLKERNAIKSDFDAIGKDLFKSLKRYEKSKVDES
ncbi:hypothetical protein [Companilactobacillus muriivasis]|uniref:hypothetical protein n=1 Tax=Companilactobacillus muriivasis TaxID=3081444 RepID=UPI0030C74878